MTKCQWRRVERPAVGAPSSRRRAAGAAVPPRDNPIYMAFSICSGCAESTEGQRGHGRVQALTQKKRRDP